MQIRKFVPWLMHIRKFVPWLLLARAALLLFSTLSCYVCVEVGYRIYRYQRLFYDYCCLYGQPTDLTGDKLFDPYLGHRYQPNIQVNKAAAYRTEARRYRTNRYGHISDEDYPIKKPAGEYRIIAIGDSFTAGITNGVRWPDVLQARLRANSSWHKKNGDAVLVINLGLDGIAAEQFANVLNFEGKKFEPDLVLVSFPLDDLRRRPYFCGLAPKYNNLRSFVREQIMGRCPWYAIYPELLANTELGRCLSLRPRLDPQLSRYYDSEDLAWSSSVKSLRRIKEDHPKVLFLHHPMMDEYHGDLEGPLRDLKKRLYRDGTDLDVIPMCHYLPDPRRERMNTKEWYQMDGHPTDLGMTLYGEAVARLLMEAAGSRQEAVGSQQSAGGSRLPPAD